MTLRLRLKAIAFDVNFRRSEMTNFLEYREQTKLKLEPDESICMVSTLRNQIVFIRCVAVKCGKEIRHVFESHKLRLEHGYWDAYMLSSYAEQCGISLVGIKKFDQLMAEKHALRMLSDK